ncbi:hypothetical protein CCP3SC15_2560001 [Gammaproteobacteria bacterium]
MWQGWIIQVSLSVANLSISRGPVASIINAVRTKYTPLLYDVTPPVRGATTTLGLQTSLSSITRYGAWYKFLSAGDCPPAAAASFQSAFLAENAWPEQSQNLSFGSGGATPKLTLNCLGYAHWLTAYPVNIANTGATLDIPAQIQAVLAASPNAVFSTDYTNMDANAYQILQYEVDGKLALNYITSLVSLGDAANNRYTFGVYENRMPWYKIAPTTAAYSNSLAGTSQQVLSTADQSVIAPWDVRPGQWIITTDLMIGRVNDTTLLRNDPRAAFIEAVSFSSPASLSLTGNKVSTLPQILAKMGLGQT